MFLLSAPLEKKRTWLNSNNSKRKIRLHPVSHKERKPTRMQPTRPKNKILYPIMAKVRTFSRTANNGFSGKKPEARPRSLYSVAGTREKPPPARVESRKNSGRATQNVKFTGHAITNKKKRKTRELRRPNKERAAETVGSGLRFTRFSASRHFFPLPWLLCFCRERRPFTLIFPHVAVASASLGNYEFADSRTSLHVSRVACSQLYDSRNKGGRIAQSSSEAIEKYTVGTQRIS